MFSPRIMFERKRRADKIREFFGRAGSDSYAESGSKSTAQSLATASPSLGSTTGKPSVDQGLSSEQRNLLVRRRRKLKAMLGDHVEDSVITTASMITPAAATIDSSGDESAPPVSERSLRVASPATALPTPEASAPSSIGSENVDFELRDAQIRQFTKIREVLGEAAPQPLLYSIKTKRGHSICMHESLVQSSDVVNAEAPVSHRMRSRIRWQRNKLMRVLGDVPSSFTSSYATNAPDNDDLSGVSESEVEDAVKKSTRQQRTRAKKLRQFFGQSLAPDAVMLQNFTRANRHLESLAEDAEGDAAADESYASAPLRSPDTSVSPPPMLVDSPQQQQQHHISAPTGSSSGQWLSNGADKTSHVPSDLGGSGSTSFDGVKPDTGGFAHEPAHQLPPPLPPQFPQILPDLVGTPESGESFPRPIRAQFWMTSSPESQASTVASQEKAKRRTSLMSHLRARKASIIGSIMRATPSASSLHHGLGRDTPTSTLRLRASTHSSTDSFDLPRNKRHSSLSLPPSAIGATSRLNFLSRKLGRVPVSPGACSARIASVYV
ncbi:hypothetical protein DL89DRAFT_114390 [Linderina pennispora]|uniref:Uncharacterized protein n=1 Tax=Linderina pennispora TaxID=61395 RepID=A0A1Y1WGJ6_9FUNG|nr:uncharacterized protein DL89DRAFT_114390 [Linderina pennispora]ORX72515.1 hypothetical protein DL89DRAFT_114390 [Linderina pennispora]